MIASRYKELQSNVGKMQKASPSSLPGLVNVNKKRWKSMEIRHFLWVNHGKSIISMAIFNSYFDITIISMAMLLMGKSIISMAIFNSYVTNYQRVFIVSFTQS